MKESMTIHQGQAYPLGLTRNGKTLTFSAAYEQGADCGLCLFASKSAILILFDESFCRGRIFSAILEHYSSAYDSYLLYEDGRFFPDPYARRILHTKQTADDAPQLNEIIVQYAGVAGVTEHDERLAGSPPADSARVDSQTVNCEQVMNRVCSLEAPLAENEAFLKELAKETRRCAIEKTKLTGWAASDDTHNTEGQLSYFHSRPLTPYAASFFYCLNVRGFTMQDREIRKKSERGTFKALEQRIPYLQSLGVTAVELMPIFEMDQETKEDDASDGLFMKDGQVHAGEEAERKSNLWGYRDGFYFAVREELACDKKNPAKEFRHMVEAFHAAGLEVVLQFWFADSCSQNMMIECIRYYVTAFSIDGIHVKSDNIPTDTLLTDPLFSDIKILGRGISPEYCNQNAGVITRFPARYAEDFMWRSRHFLKSDDLSLVPFIENAFSVGTKIGDIRYICNYDGFTLRDLVTYEHKHNEANGENSEDGRYDNVSWNCGFEGETRKKQILTLRQKQMLNAVSFVFLSVGTPLMYAGDECGNTQGGNNNPYCQDNPVGWTDLDSKGKYLFLTDYIRFLAEIRKWFTYTNRRNMTGVSDVKCTLPDISFHGVEAWKPDYGNNSHAIGVMYSLPDERHLFAALNMYWQDTRFDLPAAPAGFKWFVLSDTALSVPVYAKPLPADENAIRVQARSVVILQALPDANAPSKKKIKTKSRDELGQTKNLKSK